jgi:DNA helicase TIP49 (TBP-interacting protein)
MKRVKIKNKKRTDTEVSEKTKKIAMKFVELEKKAREDSNFDYVAAMEKLLHEERLSIGDMIEIDYYIQEGNLLTK